MIKEVALLNTVQGFTEGLKSRFEKTYQELDDYLSQLKVRYVLVNRIYERRSEGESEFIVAPEELRHMESYILDFCSVKNLMLIQKIWQQNSSCIFILADYNPSAGTTEFYRIRFSSAFKIHGRHYFTSKELLINKSYVCRTNNWHLTEPYLFITSFLQCVAAKQIDRALFLELSALWSCGKSSIRIILRRFLHTKGIELVSRSFDEEDFYYFSDHLDQIQANCPVNKFFQLANVLSNKIDGLRDIFRPSGLVVGILGRDGVGKSAFSTVLTHTLESAFEEVAFFKRHPKILYKRHIFKKSADYHFTKPHLYSERGSFASFLKLILLFNEFLTGYWLKVFPVKRRASLILYDRYFIDILADPLRYRIKGNKWLIRMMHRLLPKPDIWFILDLPTDILLQRKQELTYEMSEKLRKEYLHLSELLSNCKVINNEGQLSNTVRNASDVIIKHMQDRFHNKRTI